MLSGKGMNRHYCDRQCAEYEEGFCPGWFGEFCIIAWTPDEYKEIEDHEAYGSFESLEVDFLIP